MKMENNHMNAGTGEDSYSRNSLIQAIAVLKTIPLIKDALEGLYTSMLPKCIMVAELGCASGPNSLMLIPEIIDITYKKYRNINNIIEDEKIPEINVFLNDLPANDFNTISMSLSELYENLEINRKGDIGHLFISTTPGSYYKRLFPSNFLHFVHCSNSVHWLSQVPKKLIGKDGKSINKGNIHIADSSPPEVHEAYRHQFHEDFASFLKARAREIVVGGRMVLNLLESNESTYKPQCFFITVVFSKVLNEMVKEGLIPEEKLDDFEYAYYSPTTEELHKLIENDGSFKVEQHNHYTLDYDVPTKDQFIDNIVLKSNDFNNNEIDLYARAKFVSGPMRSGTEYLFSTHFGKELMDDFYTRVIDVLAEKLKCGKLETFHHAICLVKT